MEWIAIIIFSIHIITIHWLSINSNNFFWYHSQSKTTFSWCMFLIILVIALINCFSSIYVVIWYDIVFIQMSNFCELIFLHPKHNTISSNCLSIWFVLLQLYYQYKNALHTIRINRNKKKFNQKRVVLHIYFYGNYLILFNWQFLGRVYVVI